MNDPPAQAKAWYQSRAMWGGIIASAASVGALAGLQIDEAAAVEIAVMTANLVGGALAVYGTWKRKQPVTWRKQ